MGEKEIFFFMLYMINKLFDEEVLNVLSEWNKVVIILRFVVMKNLMYVVKVFKFVVDEILDVKLDIFGFGEDIEKIKKEIEV